MQNYRSVLNPILNGVNLRVASMSHFCAYLAWPHLFPRVPRNFLMVSKQLHLRALSKCCVVSSCLASLRFKNRLQLQLSYCLMPKEIDCNANTGRMQIRDHSPTISYFWICRLGQENQLFMIPIKNLLQIREKLKKLVDQKMFKILDKG